MKKVKTTKTTKSNEAEYSPKYLIFLETYCTELETIDHEDRVETLYRKPSGQYVLRVGKFALDGKLIPVGDSIYRIAPELADIFPEPSTKASKKVSEKTLEDRFKRISSVETFKEISNDEAVKWIVDAVIYDDNLRQDILRKIH